MKSRNFFAAVAVVSLACMYCEEVLAGKVAVKLSPENSGEFTVDVQENDDGTTKFVISRDLKRARSYPADSELTIRRDATLRVNGESGLIVGCRLEATIENNIAKYYVTLGSDCLKNAQLTVSDIDDYKNPGPQGHLIGGGEIFQIDLGEFAAFRKRPAFPLNPKPRSK